MNTMVRLSFSNEKLALVCRSALPQTHCNFCFVCSCLCVRVFVCTDCSDPRQALTYWEENLLGFESENWGTPPWEITRLPGQLENFSFRYKRTVFASLNLVDGDVIDEMEQAERLTANLNWIHELYRQHRRRHSLFILFAHGAPDGSNQDFYDLLFERIEDEYTEMRFVLVHRNGDNQAYGFEANYDENWNLDVISVLGPIWPPLQITVDARADKPDEAVSVNFEEWYDEGL